MSKLKPYRAKREDAGARLDKWFLARFPRLTFGKLAKLMRTGQVRLNGSRVKGKERLEPGDEVRIPPFLASLPEKPKREPAFSPGDEKLIKSLVIHTDDNLIALNKPPGLAVQGGKGVTRSVDRMLPLLMKKGEREAPRLVHRLDKDTSGVLVAARTRKAAQALTRAFRDRATVKIYWAVVKGVPGMKSGRIDAPLHKSPAGRREKAQVDAGGKTAVTFYRVLEHAGNEAAWVALRPVTGRTHQLRAHMAHIGHPILGDGKYGGRDAFIGGLSEKVHLHAAAIRLPRPGGGTIALKAPLPRHLRETFERLGFAPSQHDPFEGMEL